MSAHDRDARTELAYMLWQFNQGYILPEDRAVCSNWMYDDPAVMHPSDVRDREAFLATADQILSDSDWLAEVRAQAARDALLSAADAWPGLNDSGGNVYRWLRERAEQEGDQ